MEELSDRAINAYEELQKGDSRWQATVLRLSDLGYLREERLQCAALHALPLQSECRGAMGMVLDPAAGGEAKVVLDELPRVELPCSSRPSSVATRRSVTCAAP